MKLKPETLRVVPNQDDDGAEVTKQDSRMKLFIMLRQSDH